MSNVKLRVFDDSMETPTVVYGDGTSSFGSSSYQKYAVTFEQKLPFYKAMSALKPENNTFRFDK